MIKRRRLCFVFVFVLFFPHSFTIFALLSSLPPSRSSDPGSHSRLFFPLPTRVRALHFYRENISALSSLVDSRRIVPTHARPSQQLIPFFIFANKFRISPRRDSNSQTNTSSIRGLPPDHRDDRLCTCIIYTSNVLVFQEEKQTHFTSGLKRGVTV